MKVRIEIGEQVIAPTSFDLKISDYMDGTPDSLSLSFPYSGELSENIYMKKKALVKLFTDDEETNIKTYSMVIDNITSNKNSMELENGYFITLTLKEQTIFLKDCVKTDIAISPFLYPKIKIEKTQLNEVTGEVEIVPDEYTERVLFDTLYDAVLKVISVHNTIPYNEQILNMDEKLIDRLKNVACSNLTYTDLTTFEQLKDLFIRIGCVPYFEDGVLFGLPLQGKYPRIAMDITEKSGYESIKDGSMNYGAVSTKVENSLFDEETAVYPSIYRDSILKNEDYLISSFNYQPGEEAETSLLITEEYSSFLSSDEGIGQGKNSNALFVGGFTADSDFNEAGDPIQDAKSYNLILPTNIERVKQVYALRPKITTETTYNGKVAKLYLQKTPLLPSLNDGTANNLYEKNVYDRLSQLRQKTNAYYKRGGNTIYNPLSLLQSVVDTSFLEDFNDSLEGAWIGAGLTLYNELKKFLYVVEYVPLKSTSYLGYAYNKEVSLEEFKPKSIASITLPYKLVSDKQVSNILSYELEKRLDTTYNVKFITKDTNILGLEASDIVTFEDEEYIITSVDYVLSRYSIECSFKLNKKIIVNNAISGYKDEIRKSDNLATNNVVVRDIPIYKENVISLSTNRTVNDSTNDLNFDTFDMSLKDKSLYNLGLIGEEDSLLLNSRLKEIPFVTKTLKDNNDYNYAISLDDASLPPKRIDFPIYVGLVLQKLTLGLNSIFIEANVREGERYALIGELVKCETPEELETFLSSGTFTYTDKANSLISQNNYELTNNPETRLCRATGDPFILGFQTLIFTKLPYLEKQRLTVSSLVPYEFVSVANQEDVYPNNPSYVNIDGTTRFLSNDFPYSKGDPKTYKGLNLDIVPNILKNEDNLLNTTGNIFNVYYNYLTPETIGNKLFSTDLNSNDIKLLLEETDSEEVFDNKITATLPILYNTSDEGASIKGIGVKENEEVDIKIYDDTPYDLFNANYDTITVTGNNVSISNNNGNSIIRILEKNSYVYPLTNVSFSFLESNFITGKYRISFDYELNNNLQNNIKIIPQYYKYLTPDSKFSKSNGEITLLDNGASTGSISQEFEIKDKTTFFDLVLPSKGTHNITNIKLERVKDEFNFNRLPNIDNNRGFSLDLREHPNPYIQYTTIYKSILNDDDVEIVEINKLLKWVSYMNMDNELINGEISFKLGKVRKGKRLSSLELGEMETTYNVTTEYDKNGVVKLSFLEPINKGTESEPEVVYNKYSLEETTDFDYVLYRQVNKTEEYNNEINITPMIRFRVNKETFNIEEDSNEKELKININYDPTFSFSGTIDNYSTNNNELTLSSKKWSLEEIYNMDEFNLDINFTLSREPDITLPDKLNEFGNTRFSVRGALYDGNNVSYVGGFLFNNIIEGDENIIINNYDIEYNNNLNIRELILNEFSTISEDIDGKYIMLGGEKKYLKNLYYRLFWFELIIEINDGYDGEELLDNTRLDLYFKEEPIGGDSIRAIDKLYLKYEIKNNYEIGGEENE